MKIFGMRDFKRRAFTIKSSRSGVSRSGRQCVWVDTSNEVASFHSVEKGRPMQFEQHTTFMAYLNSLVTQGYRFQ